MNSWTVRVALLGVLVLLAASCDWMMYGYGPQRTRYNPTEHTIGVGNVANLTNVWTDVLGPGASVDTYPAVANRVVSVGAGDGRLYAFDAAGSTNCSGTPKICSPLWSSTATHGIVESSPAVANGVVYIGSASQSFAFDAAGSTGCSGTPKTCAPLWTAAFAGAGIGGSSPSVANGVVYIGSADPAFSLVAFDAAGSIGCSGTPKTCAPLWNDEVDPYATSTISSSPAVANGLVFGANSATRLAAFDAAGSTKCSGTFKVCSPLWYANFGDEEGGGDPTVANGVVYVGEGSKLRAYDAAGSNLCA